MIRKASFFFTFKVGVYALQGQTKEVLQKQKQKAFTVQELAKELLEQTAEKSSRSGQQYRRLLLGLNSRGGVISKLEPER